MQILVADDSKMGREILRMALVKNGHTVTEVENGTEALAAMRKQSVRLVISDWEMPGMGGIELCRAIRNGGFPGYIYIILVTGRERRDKMEALVAGANDFMLKPFVIEDLVVRVRCAELTIAVQMRESALFMLATLIESRGAHTSRHPERIRRFAQLLAQDLGGHHLFAPELNTEFIRDLYLAAPLHDIGNASLPDSILLKSGRFSKAEFAIIQSHTTLGAKAIAQLASAYPESSLFRIASQIALTHHEQYDGKGYPQGLRGDEIPLAGRIVAVADAYDSLTSVRNYRPAYGYKEAHAMIVEEKGKRFDPRIVEGFVRIDQQLIDIASRFRDLPE